MIVNKYARERAKEETGLLLAHSVNRLLDSVYLLDSLLAVGDTIEIGKQLREVHRLTMLAEKFNALYLEMKTDLIRAHDDEPPVPDVSSSGGLVAPLPAEPTEEQKKRTDEMLAANGFIEKPVDEDIPF